LAASRIEMANILRLCLPIGGLRAMEIGVFLAAGILIGLLGAAALAAHQLVLNCASISFMVPLGLGQAATVRVAYEFGAGRPFAARRAAFVALALGIAFMSAAAVVLWTAPETIIAIYVDIADPANRETIEIARRLLVIAAIFQVFDGVQVIAAGALRGYRSRCCSPASAIGAPGSGQAGSLLFRSAMALPAYGGAWPWGSQSSPSC
jgi:MATE family multidrug resistance protein